MEEFETLRPRLFGVAYRMVGSAMDAEDILQEAYLRWQATDQSAVACPAAFLVTMVTRMAIDHLRSAQVQRETYIGPWLPEPILAAQAPESGDPLLLAESLSTAFLVVLESLNPVERAVFLLHDVFDYDFEEIAPMVGKSAANCRQIARRAREAIRARRPRFEPSTTEHERLMQQFLEAAQEGDLPGLVNLLADDIVLQSDGGGKATAVPRPIHGAKRVAAFILALARLREPGSITEAVTLNGLPGLVYVVEGEIRSALLFTLGEGRMQAVHAVVNPDKLAYLSRQLGIGE
jgi:RNA polymerase sigma-70 factor (ECF subfamily)